MKILGFLKGCRLYGAYLGVFIGMALGQIVSPSVAATGVIEDDSPSEATSVISRNAVTLTLAEVMALSLAHHPRLEAIAQEREASNGSLRQAKTLANPMLTIMDENLGNDRLAEAGDRAISLQVGQLIELGGKRSARIAVADQARLLANWSYAAKRLDIIFEVKQRFIDMLAAQMRLDLAQDLADVADQTTEVVAKRVQAGKVSPIEHVKAQLVQANAQVELAQAQRYLDAARSALAASMGQQTPKFEAVQGVLDETPEIPPLDVLENRLLQAPEQHRWENELARQEALLAGEKAKRIPDLTLIAGASRYSQFDDVGYHAGVSLPLPLFDRNRGGVEQASRRLDKAEYERLDDGVGRRTELLQNHQQYLALSDQLATLRETLLPGAERAFAATQKGYQLGKFGFLEVLDAQRTLFQTNSLFVQVQADRQRVIARIERIVGGELAVTAPSVTAP